MATTDWALDQAPIFELPEDRRLRLALSVREAKTYTRVGGVVVRMPPNHFIVWSSWTIDGDGRITGTGLPAYVPRDAWGKTYRNERPGTAGYVWADKCNRVRAARYTGTSATRILVNENDPASPDTWAVFGPGDHVVLAVDEKGRPMTYVGPDGVERFDQYPIHGDNWEKVGWRPQVPLAAGLEPTIAGRTAPVVLAPVRSVEPPGADGPILL